MSLLYSLPPDLSTVPLYEFPYGLNFVPFGATPEPYGKPLPDCRQVSVFLCALAAPFFRRSLPFPFYIPHCTRDLSKRGIWRALRRPPPRRKEARRGVWGLSGLCAGSRTGGDRFRLYGVQGGPVREKTQDTGRKKVPHPGDFFAFGGGVPFFFCGAVLQ